MRKYLLASAITTWIVTITYSAISIVWPVEGFDPLQRVANTGAAVLTMLWWLERKEIDYTLGYRSGCADQAERERKRRRDDR